MAHSSSRRLVKKILGSRTSIQNQVGVAENFWYYFGVAKQKGLGTAGLIIFFHHVILNKFFIAKTVVSQGRVGQGRASLSRQPRFQHGLMTHPSIGILLSRGELGRGGAGRGVAARVDA